MNMLKFDDRRRVTLPPGGLAALLDSMAEAGEGDRASLGDITSSLGPAGLGGAILVPALIALSPATMVIGVTSVTGIAIAAIAAQIMLDASELWLPDRIKRISIRRSALVWLRDRLRAPFAAIERWSKPRLRFLMRSPFGHVPGAVTFMVGAAMPFLEFVPLSATVCGAAVTLMVLGLLLDDGAIVVAGFMVTICAVLIVYNVGTGALGLLGI